MKGGWEEKWSYGGDDGGRGREFKRWRGRQRIIALLSIT